LVFFAEIIIPFKMVAPASSDYLIESESTRKMTGNQCEDIPSLKTMPTS
jgi:hypothetical protein